MPTDLQKIIATIDRAEADYPAITRKLVDAIIWLGRNDLNQVENDLLLASLYLRDAKNGEKIVRCAV